MRAIDADELKENLKKWFPKFTLDGIEAKTLFNQILHDIDNAPTIEQKKEIVPVCKVIFDKEQLQEMVDKKIADLLESGALSKVEQKQSVDDKSKTCDNCKYYLFRSTEYPCARCRRNNALVDEIREQQNDRWKDGTTNG